MKQVKLFPMLLTSAWLFSCGTGYQKEHGTWVWVTNDENYGRRSTPLAPVDNASFKVLSNKKYARDKDHVFFSGKIIAGADPSSIDVLGSNGYAKDKDCVYLDGHKVLRANPVQFEVLEFPYARDAEHVFCGTLPVYLDASEVPSFKVTNEDKLMAGMRSTIFMPHFTEIYPEYKWIDSLGIEAVLIGEWATGASKNKKIKGLKVLD